MKVSSVMQFCFIAALATFVAAQDCPYEIHLWEVLAAPNNGLMTINDGSGARDIKVEKLAGNKCPEWSGDPTGTETGGAGSGSRMTTISLTAPFADGQTDGSDGKCRINNSTSGDKTSHWFPLQGLHVSTPGWRFQPQDIRISDVDMDGENDDVETALRKAALVFGYKGNQLINATWKFPGGSALIQHDMKIEHKAMTAQWEAGGAASEPRVNAFASPAGGFGFTRPDDTHSWFRGIMTTYGDNGPVPYIECTDAGNEDLCAASFSFDEPIDGFYILHALEWKSETRMNSRISVGPMSLPCGCKCKRIETVTRSITLPTAADNTKCTRKVITDDQFTCDPTAGLWCETKSYDRYTITGPEAGGLWPCEKSNGEKAHFLHIFDSPPTPAAVPSPV